MANTSKLTKEERKKAKRTARKKRKAEKPLKPRDYAADRKSPRLRNWRAARRSGKQDNSCGSGRTRLLHHEATAGCEFASGDHNRLSQPTTESTDVIRTSDNQLFCCKSIDKLISESEAPGQRLQKTLGPWSLTALGIGAIIGSGIFVLTGTAAAGEYFKAPPSCTHKFSILS